MPPGEGLGRLRDQAPGIPSFNLSVDEAHSHAYSNVVVDCITDGVTILDPINQKAALRLRVQPAASLSEELAGGRARQLGRGHTVDACLALDRGLADGR